MKSVGLDEFRRILAAEPAAAALCGAGVSIPAPTRLPAGNELRDLTLNAVLRDSENGAFLDALLSHPSYRAMLPEAALQEIGYAVQPHVDRFIARLIGGRPANHLHRMLASRFREIFTTNFDRCLEAAGAHEVHHLHGSAESPASLQNRLWRLGRTAGAQLNRFTEAADANWLFVAGYSLRDADVLQALKSASALRLLYLSHTGEIPPALGELRGTVLCATGSLDTLFDSPAPRGDCPPLKLPRIRQPAMAQRALALIYLLSTCGMVEQVLALYERCLPRFRGPERLRAAALLADTLRTAQRFEEARLVSKRALAGAGDAYPDLRSWLLTLLGLCEHESGGDLFAARKLYMQAVRAMNDYGRAHPQPPGPERVAVWKAKLANNLGNVERDIGHPERAKRLYRYSIGIKEAYGEEPAAALTRANLAVLNLRQGDWGEAVRILDAAIPALRKSPEPYICQTIVYDLALAMVEAVGGPSSGFVFGKVDLGGLARIGHTSALPGDFAVLLDRLHVVDALRASTAHKE